jgi:hypothetical protein
MQDMRYVATLRNRLIHERGFDALPNRKEFTRRFETSSAELAKLISARQKARGEASSCVVM